ncbi:hypothetical protein F4859DRAFT_69852 [Xylaria cf. heliscus]|nr:hypothetical protein F4859DRAFT_69852 [Xylaria cf. heliscus]
MVIFICPSLISVWIELQWTGAVVDVGKESTTCGVMFPRCISYRQGENMAFDDRKPLNYRSVSDDNPKGCEDQWIHK